MNKFLLIFLMTFSMASLADEAKQILIRSFKGQENLNPSINSAIKRTILKKIAELPGYQLVLSSEAPPVASVNQAFALEGIIFEEKNFYRIELSLLDLKKQSVVNAIKKSDVREEDLVRMIQGAIEALFLPLEKTKKKVTNSSEPEDFNRVTNVANPNAVNFKERIQGLMSDADTAITKKASDNQADLSKENQSNSSGSNASGELISTIDHEGLFNKKNLLKILKYHSLAALFEKKSIETDSLVNTASESTYFRMMARGHLWRNQSYRYSVNYSFDFSKALDAKVTSPNLISYGLMGVAEFETLSMGLGSSQENELFYNIQSPGSGLAAGTLSVMWLNFMLKKKLGGESKHWLFSGQYKHPLSSKSQWQTISSISGIEGQGFQVEISPPLVVKGVNFRIIYQRTNLKLQGDFPFTLSENRIMTGAHYQF